MNIGSPLAYPAAGTLSAWWRQLAPQQPLAGWVAHLFCHRVDVVVGVARRDVLDPVMASPRYDDPMWQALRDLGAGWLLPGL